MPFASGLVVVVVARVTLGTSRLSNSISLRVGLDNIMFVLLLTDFLVGMRESMCSLAAL